MAAAQAKLRDIETLGSVRDLTAHLVFEAGSDRGERFATHVDKVAAQ